MTFYRFIWKLTRLIAHLRHQVEFHPEGEEPRGESLMVIANHCSFLDPFLVGIAVRRPLIFLAKKELYEHLIPRLFLHGMRSQRLNRDSSDLEAAKICLRLFDQGKSIGIFPEGTRSETGHFNRALVRSGFLKIAQKRDAYVQAVGIAGSFESYPRGRAIPHAGKIVLCLAPPVRPSEILKRFEGEPPRVQVEKGCAFFCDEIERLMARAHRIRRARG